MVLPLRVLSASLAALIALAPAPAESPGPGGRMRTHASNGERILAPERATSASDDGRWEVEVECTSGDPTTISTRSVLLLREEGERARRLRLDAAVARCAVANDGLVAVAAYAKLDLLDERDVPCFLLGLLPRDGDLRVVRVVRLPVRDGRTQYDVPEPRGLEFVGDLLLLRTQVIVPPALRREWQWYDRAGERLATWDTESLAPEGSHWTMPESVVPIPAHDVVVSLWKAGDFGEGVWAVRVDSVADLAQERTARPEPVLFEEVGDERRATLEARGSGTERTVLVALREEWNAPPTKFEVRAFGPGKAAMRQLDEEE